jgi:starch synthase (maltosyl-transferring)
MDVGELRRRVVIAGVRPHVDCGQYPIKRIVGETVSVEADVFADGHDSVSAVLLHRHSSAAGWTLVPMKAFPNDVWRAEFTVQQLGVHLYTVEAWVDAFATWRRDLKKRVDAGQDVAVELLSGARLLQQTSERASGPDAELLARWAGTIANPTSVALALSDVVADLAAQYPDRTLATRYDPPLPVTVDPPRAGFSAWYEFFPRSCSPEPGRHGTFRDAGDRLDYIASMGFDVVYLPPIHPIGRAYRKGKNNAVTAEADDVGSPWAIGAVDGGHTAVHPDLGTMDDFLQFVAAAKQRGIEVAMDVAFQCSPDHPYVAAHPQWFRKRPDGSIQYAENPPKKYQDIYPLDFETGDWRALWDELTGVIRFWVDKGIRIFRVDNPHTKAFPFWEYSIGQLKQDHPDLIFLSEAFTRPKVMYQLAKLGFTQSYTYFTWRNTKQELTDYFTELTQTRVREFFRPNLWPNTPDILPEYLQFGGRPSFISRLVLAATLSSSYGIYGPAYELCENRPRAAGSEEYLDSEKYALRRWNLDDPWSLRDVIARVNSARRENPALHSNWSLRFHDVDNDKLMCYSKTTRDFSNIVLVVVNLDPEHKHSGWVNLDLTALGLDAARPYQVHDLIGDNRHLWSGARNFVELDPKTSPVHLLRIRTKVRTEQDFDYFL